MFNPNIIAPQRPIGIAPMVTLEPIDIKHIDRLFTLMEENIHQVQRVLPWVDTNMKKQDIDTYIKMCMEKSQQGESFVYVLWVRGFFAGSLEVCWGDQDHHDIHQNRYVHLKFWIGKRYQGFGIMTHTVMVTTGHVFSIYGVECVGIVCPTDNIAGQKVAQGAGYTRTKALQKDIDLYCQVAPVYTSES